MSILLLRIIYWKIIIFQLCCHKSTDYKYEGLFLDSIIFHLLYISAFFFPSITLYGNCSSVLSFNIQFCCFSSLSCLLNLFSRFYTFECSYKWNYFLISIQIFILVYWNAVVCILCIPQVCWASGAVYVCVFLGIFGIWDKVTWKFCCTLSFPIWITFTLFSSLIL